MARLINCVPLSVLFFPDFTRIGDAFWLFINANHRINYVRFFVCDYISVPMKFSSERLQNCNIKIYSTGGGTYDYNKYNEK